MSRTIRFVLLVAGLAVVTLLIIRAGPALVVDMLTRVGWSFAAVVAVNVTHLILRSVALWRSVLGGPVRFVDVLRIRFSSEAVEVLTSTGPFLAEPAKGWWCGRQARLSAGPDRRSQPIRSLRSSRYSSRSSTGIPAAWQKW